MSLCDAVHKHNVGDVIRLLEDPAVDVNAVNRFGATPFAYACMNQTPEMIRLFLNSKRETNYNQGNVHGFTGFHWACYLHTRSIMEMLLADQRITVATVTRKGNNCLHLATFTRPSTDLLVAMQVLLASGRPEIPHLANAPNEDGSTPRDTAFDRAHTNLVALLDAYNADPIGTRDQLCSKLYPEYRAAELFATIVLLCDDYYEIKRE